jgi:hypothetical protein
MSRHLGWRAFGVLAVSGAAVALRISRLKRLVLNLWGGTQVVLESRATETQPVEADTVSRTQVFCVGASTSCSRQLMEVM